MLISIGVQRWGASKYEKAKMYPLKVIIAISAYLEYHKRTKGAIYSIISTNIGFQENTQLDLSKF